MQREIKFRGKRLDNGEWAYGAFVPDALEQTHGKMVTWGFIRRYRPNQTVESVEMIEVDRNTVGQYTGLKDKNGKEIYEGDIIDHFAVYGYVIFEDGMFTLNTSANNQFGNHKQPICYVDTTQCEVIGNTYENPELLEVSE